jgi:hypothetical protein
VRACTAAEGAFSATDAEPRCTREVVWAGETERGVGAVEVLASDTSKFRRLLDGDSFCFSRFIHDRLSFSVMVMRVRDKARAPESGTIHLSRKNPRTSLEADLRLNLAVWRSHYSGASGGAQFLYRLSSATREERYVKGTETLSAVTSAIGYLFGYFILQSYSVTMKLV